MGGSRHGFLEKGPIQGAILPEEGNLIGDTNREDHLEDFG